ncbi:hypothetical protein [Coleofasciculus sp.]|uniref:hypothetical protein n=1 Tax=Coleofasciculus sp. TaxID=3100458 RepID=UPI003A3C8F1D
MIQSLSTSLKLSRSLFVCEARIALPPPTRQTPNPTAFQVSGKVAIAFGSSEANRTSPSPHLLDRIGS